MVTGSAAGNDWVERSHAAGHRFFTVPFMVKSVRESILGVVLFMNQKMNLMVKNYQKTGIGTEIYKASVGY